MLWLLALACPDPPPPPEVVPDPVEVPAPVALRARPTPRTPADGLPTPRAEPCVQLGTDVEEGEILASRGLGHSQVKASLDAVIQTALECGQPEGMSEVHLSFDLVVGCDGLVARLETTDGGGAPADYVTCVSDVVHKADFPAHDMPDGMDVTYPVHFRW